MKVLILANKDTGLYFFRKELLEELLKQHEVVISVPKGEFEQPLTAMGCRLIDTRLDRRGTNPLKDLELMKFYKGLISSEKPDIVFTYTIKPNVYGGMACAKLGVPYVVNVTGLGTALENKGPMQALTKLLYKAGIRKAQKVFFQNTENRDFMVSNGMLSGPYDMLPGSGVSLDRYQLTEYPDGDTVDFVFVARIMKQKGIDQYLDAARLIRKEYPETRFHVCGFCEQAYEETLNRLNADGTVIYHGMVKDMTEIYGKMSCTVHPTYYPEGLSNVLLESAATGRPVITTNRAGCREVVDDGVNGYIVKEKDSASLIAAIEKFLKLSREERKQMGLNGRKKVEKDFDRKIVIEKYMAELNK